MDRKQKYYFLNTKLSYYSNKEINNIKPIKEFKGWGKNAIIEIDNIKIFTKRVVITKLEYDNLFDTSNLFNLPTYYNYPIGSAGFNCFRELAMHVKTTNWVLEDKIENFPLMYPSKIYFRSAFSKQICLEKVSFSDS